MGNKVITTLMVTGLYLFGPDLAFFTTRPQVQLANSQYAHIAMTFKANRPEITFGQMEKFGKKLFFDPRFSQSGQIACSSCHEPELDFTDGRPTSIGLGTTSRNAPSLVNVRLNHWFFWDGRAHTLEKQVFGPIEAAKEHGSNMGQVTKNIVRFYKDEYETLFPPISENLVSVIRDNFDISPKHKTIPSLDIKLSSYAVGTLSSHDKQTRIIHEAASKALSPYKYFSEVTTNIEQPPSDWVIRFNQLDPELKSELQAIYQNFAQAIASYERTIVALDSPFDRFLAKLSDKKDTQASFVEGFGQEEWSGFKVFINSECHSCHRGANFTDQQFHNVGLPEQSLPLDIGRAKGVLVAKLEQLNCEDQLSISESCSELEFIDANNVETMGAFKTPSLRNLSKTAPYMHDGRFSSLESVLTHYQDSNIEPAIGHRSEAIPTNLNWTKVEQKLLIKFLRSLQSELETF